MIGVIKNSSPSRESLLLTQSFIQHSGKVIRTQLLRFTLRSVPGDRRDVGLGLAHLVELLGQEVPEDDLEVDAAQVPVVPHAQDLSLGVRLAVASVVGLDLKLHVQNAMNRNVQNITFIYCQQMAEVSHS